MKKKTDMAANKVAIEFDKKQYEVLVRALQIAGSIYGIIGDFVSDEYVAHADAIEDLESWILAHAGGFGLASVVEIFEGKNVLKDEVIDKYADDLIAYEEWAFWDLLVHKLVDRELARRYTLGDLGKMEENELIDLHFELEEKFGKEIDEYGIGGLEWKKNM